MRRVQRRWMKRRIFIRGSAGTAGRRRVARKRDVLEQQSRFERGISCAKPWSFLRRGSRVRSAWGEFAAMASIRSVLMVALCVAAVWGCHGRVLPTSDGEIAMVTDSEALASAGRFSDVLGNSLDVALFTGFAAKYVTFTCRLSVMFV